MSERRLDEAVEAMAPIVFPEAWKAAERNQPRGSARYWQAAARERAAKALAALPAGVYVSDGQGNVETPDESVAAAALFEFAREECGWGSHEWDLCQQMTGVVLAALSATDTEDQ